MNELFDASESHFLIAGERTVKGDYKSEKNIYLGSRGYWKANC